jgi:hypothetical protein
MKRLFLVGCARSGTTLLQSLLASHPDIASFPESNFFNNLFSHNEPKRNRLGIISRRAKPRLAEFLQESGCSAKPPSPLIVFPNQLTAHFSKTLDQLATQQGKNVWVEKTPTHLYHLGYITRHISEPKFIHLIREGKDTVASLYDVRKNYPKQWANEPASIELSVNRWMQDVAISLQYVNVPNHSFVRYESLVADTQSILERLCQAVEINFNRSILNGYAATAQQVSLAREPWKSGVSSPIYNANSTKFYDLFDQSQQDYILQRTSAIDLSFLQNQ